MQLYRFLNEFVRAGESILVYMDLKAGTKENFTVEVMRGQRCHRWREEYGEWLKPFIWRSRAFPPSERTWMETRICSASSASRWS